MRKMAVHSRWTLLFFVLLSSSCYAQLSSVELRQVEYNIDSDKNDVDVIKDESSTENESSQNNPKGNDIEEPFKKATKPPYCLGCVINVPPEQPGVTEMVERAVSAMDQIVSAPTIHATPRVLGVQKQVVNGIQYYIQIEVSLSDCPPSTSLPRDQCNPLPGSPSIICEVIFLNQPWKDPKPQLMGNNCTDADSDNNIENFTPDDLLAVERSSGEESTYPMLQQNDETQTSTERKLEATTSAVEDTFSAEEEDRNGRTVNAGPGMMKAMDSSEIDLVNELADIAVCTLNELETGDSHKQVIDIVDAKKQIVNGLMYHLVLRVGSKSCADETPDCQMQGWVTQSICNVQLHRSWAEDAPYKAKVVNSECEEAWEETREARQLSENWALQDMYDPQHSDCIKEVLSKAYNIVPKDIVTLSSLMRQDVSPKSIKMMAELKLPINKSTNPNSDMKETLVLRPMVVCKHDAEKSSRRVAESDDTTDIPIVLEMEARRSKRSPQTEKLPVLGGVQDADKNGAGVQEASTFAVNELTKREGTNTKLVLLEVVDAKTQVVQGISYHLTLKVSESNCNKGDSSASNCQALPDGKRELCTLKVWSKPWLNETSLHDVECKLQPTKRSADNIPGGLSDADKNSAEVKGAVDFAVKELDKSSNSGYEKKAVEVIEAKQQVVAGVLYHLKIKVANCRKGESSACEQDNEVCSLKVWSRPWLNSKEVSDLSCSPSRSKRSDVPVLGGVQDADKNGAGVQEASTFAVNELTKREGTNTKLVLLEVVDAKTQVVQGISYHLTLKVSESNCNKGDSSVTNCQALPDGKQELCSLKVWSKSWLNEMSVHDVDCKVHRTKRASNNIPGGLRDADKNSAEVKGAVDFAVKELDKSSNSGYEKKAVEVIEAKQQVVAGVLYHLKIKVANCRKGESSACEQHHEECSVKVWSRPWLNSMEVTDVSCSPSITKRSVSNIRGGIVDADENSPDVVEAIAFATRKLDESLNSIYKTKVIEVVKAQRQTVAGSLYHLELKLGDSTCRKTDETTVEQCDLLPNGDVRMCIVKVWSRPWLNETSLTGVDCKRSVGTNIVGGLTDADQNDLKVAEAIAFAFQKLDNACNSIYKQKLVEVVKAQQQNVDGTLYHLTLKLGDSTCTKGGETTAENCDLLPNGGVQMCTVKVLSKRWLMELYFTENDCVPLEPTLNKGAVGPSNSVPGGPKDVDQNSPDVKEAIAFAVENLNRLTNSMHKQKVVDVVKAERQTVAGVVYHLTLMLGESTCSKSDSVDAGECDLLPNGGVQMCTVKVWYRPWLKKFDVADNHCDPLRAASTNIPGGLRDAEKNSADVKGAVDFAVKELDKNSNSGYEKKAVEVIEARQQVVAGVLYHLKIKVANCRKGESSACEQDHEVCSLKVWSKPWLNSMEISDVSCSPNRSKRSPNVGGLTDVEDLEDPYIQDVAEFSRSEIDKATNSRYSQKVVRVIEAKKQVVSGVLVHLKLELIRTGCSKKTKDLSSCQALPDQKSQICEVKIWDRPWLKVRKVKSMKCADAQIITSQEPDVDATVNLFSNFVNQFNKKYSNELERQRRFEIFKENLNVIKELRNTEQGTATYGPTMFADLTHDEFKKHYLGLRSDLHQENSVPFPQAQIPSVQLPKEFDWRDHNAVTPVKNQGSCGSCWAFAVTGNVEGQYALKYKKLLSFSEQELVDCDKIDDGCQGGLPDNAYRALEQLGGLELEEEYPYDGKGESCSFNKSLTRVRVRGGLNITSNETDMAKWLVQNGPIAIGINANAMQFYMGGVSHPLKFLCSPSSLDHGVLIVGFGEHRTRYRKKLLPYWLIKNSWGKFWGEQGYYRVYRGDGSCGVNMMASSAIIE